MSVGMHKYDGSSLFNLKNCHLVLTWLTGMVFGMIIAYLGQNHWHQGWKTVQFFHRCPAVKVFSVLLPFLFSALAVSIAQPKWLLIICAIKSFGYGCLLVLFCVRYGQAAWLAWLLIAFLDVCSMPLLLHYWCLNLSYDWKKSWLVYLSIFLTLLALIIVDYQIVTPYVMRSGFI